MRSACGRLPWDLLLPPVVSADSDSYGSDRFPPRDKQRWNVMGFKIEMKGLRNLRRLGERARAMNGTRSVPVKELLTDWSSWRLASGYGSRSGPLEGPSG